MSGIKNILHLSDLHFGYENKTDSAKRKNVLNALEKSLENLKSTDLQPDVVVISGDIGWKSAEEDYKIAQGWIEKFLSLLGLTSEQLIMCVGNHDIDAEEAEFLTVPTDWKQADKLLAIETIKRISSPFAKYEDFCKSIKMPQYTIGNENHYLMGYRDIDNLRFVVLNSAWFFRKDKSNDLWIGLPQLEIMKSENQLKDDDKITISVLHHPKEFLHEEETNSYGTRTNTYRYLAENSHLILSGHTHAVFEKPSKIYDEAYLFTGGSVYSNNSHRNNYCVIQVDSKKEKAKYRHFDYDPAHGEWIEVIKYKNGKVDEEQNYIQLASKKKVTDLKQSSGKINRQELNKMINILDRLRENSKERYKILTGPGGRFRHLNISEILLTTSKISWIDTSVKTDDREMPIVESINYLWGNGVGHALIKGDGGMGKTVSLIRIWKEYILENSNTQTVSLFIPLNEFNTVREGDRKNFIIKMIGRYYYKTQNINEQQENEIWEVLRTPLNEGKNRIPSIIILLDGFNEVTVKGRDRDDLLIEINYLVQNASGAQIIMTSRSDIRTQFGWNGFNLLELQGLNDTKIKEYLSKLELKIKIPEDQRMFQLLRNPMMLTLFAKTCEILEHNKNNKDYNFKDNMQSTGEILWNFIECQLAMHYERSLSKQQLIKYSFILKHVLPYVGYKMESEGLYDFQEKRFLDIINEALQEILDKDFFKVFDEYDIEKEMFDEYAKNRNCAYGIKDIICNELIMMVEEENSIRFLHQNFRDYFAAVHIINSIYIELAGGKNKSTDILSSRILGSCIKRFIGEIEGEHYNKPILEEIGWSASHYKKTIIGKLLDKYRGKFDRENEKCVINIIDIWKEVRVELTGSDLSNLNLNGCIFNNIRCSRQYKEKYLAASFEKSLISERGFLPQGHSDSVINAVYSADGTKILTASWDRTIKEWNVETGECIKTYKGHLDSVNSAVYSKDGIKILTASSDRTIKEWKVETGECIKTYTGHFGIVTSAVYSFDGTKILTASNDRTIKEWNVETGECIKTYEGHGYRINSAIYSSDGTKILTASSDTTIKEWEVETGKCIKTYEGHSDIVTSAVYSIDRTKILTTSWDRTIKEWEVETEKCIKTYEGHSYRVNSAVYSADGTKILTASWDGTIKEWKVETGECVKTYQGHWSRVNSAVYSPDGIKILTASEEKTIKEWNVETGECIKTYQGHLSGVNSAVYSNDGTKILIASDDNRIKEWDIETGECIKIYKGRLSRINSAIYNVDGTKILTASESKIIKEWKIDTEECIKFYQGHLSGINSAVYSSDGIKILTASSDRTIKEWKVETGECIKTYVGHSDIVNSAVYSSDGIKMLTASRDRTIKEWKVETGECIKTYVGHSDAVTNAVYSADGTKILTTSRDGTIKEWKAKTGECIRTYVGHSYIVNSAVYSIDGTKILTASSDRTIKEWKVETGECIRTYEGHLDIVNSAVYSKNGTKILTASGDSTIKEWSVETGECIITMENVQGLIITGCNFKNLHPESKKYVSENFYRIMKMYRATLTECEPVKEIAFTSIQINNYKKFKSKNFKCNDKFTLIIGDNGTGKTSSIEAFAVGIGNLISLITGKNEFEIESDDIRRKIGTDYLEYALPMKLGYLLQINGEIYQSRIEINNSLFDKIIFGEKVANYFKSLVETIQGGLAKDLTLPAFGYYGISRIKSQNREDWNELDSDMLLSRFDAYANCMKQEIDIKLFSRWLKRAIGMKNQGYKVGAGLNAVINAVNEFMKGLSDGNFEGNSNENNDVEVDYNFQEEVIVKINNEKIPLRMMSSGYRSVIGMVSDIAYRMSILNPHFGKNAYKETPGIILIDEIDLHLHPKWQRTIVDDLKRTFPKCQFIATTHAPIIIQNFGTSNIINLNTDHNADYNAENYTQNEYYG